MRLYLFSLRVLACLAIFFAAFSLSCRSKTPDEADANKPEPSPERIEAETDANLVEPGTTTETTTDSIAVIVNGIDITESEIEKLIKPQLEKITAKATQLPPAFLEQQKRLLRARAVEEMVQRKLLDEKVKEANIVVTEEQVISRIRAMASEQQPPLSLQDVKKRIESYGQSFEEYKNELSKQLGYLKLMEAQWADKINVTEEDAKKYYDENPTRFQTPELVRASHILIEPDLTDPNADPNQAKAKAKAKIQNLLKQIKEGGDFAELAKANSDCASAARGGDLDFFPRGQMAAPFEKAAFELEVGQLSDIVETRYGYHIIKVTDHKDAGHISFEQAKDNIINELTQKKQSEFVKKYIDSLMADANIVYPPGKEPSSVTGRP